MALDPLNRSKMFDMSRHWEEMEGEVEAWICPTCGNVTTTRMTRGVRKTVGGILVPMDEKEEPCFQR